MKPPILLIVVLIALRIAGAADASDAPARPAASGTGAVATPQSLQPNLETRTLPKNENEPASGGNGEGQVQTRPFILTIQRAHLFGDWGGLLPKLADLGITPTLTYVSDSAGNPIGGIKHGASYSDNIGLGLVFDLQKIFNLGGASLLISMSQRDGDSLSKNYVGNVFSIQQVFGGETFHLIDFAYQQKLFNDHLELSLGRLAAGDDFLVSAYDYLFMQNGFDGNPVGIFFNAPGMSAYPNAAWGTRVKLWQNKRLYVMAGIYNGDATIRSNYRHGTDLSMHGPPFAIAEIGYRCNGLPGDSQYLGDYKAGAWYDDDLYSDFRSVARTTPAGDRRGNWGVYGLFDQVVLPFAEPGSNRGLGIFGSALISPDTTISQLPYFFTAGLACRGIVASRPRDVIGLGWIYGEFSSDLEDAQRREQLLSPAVGVQNHESVLELTYRCNMNEGSLFIQPDLQYIFQPGGTGDIKDAFVVGCQLGLNF